MTSIVISHESCEAEVYFNEGIASIQVIGSKEEGKGHATKCIEKIEIIAKNKKIQEIWFPTVLSKRMESLLKHLGYEFTNFGPHPMMPDTGDVIGYKKILRKKMR